MIDAKATALSYSMMRPSAAQSTPVNPKQLLSAGPVQDPAARGLNSPLAAPALNLVPVDAFQAGGLPNARFGMPALAPQQLGIPALAPQQLGIPALGPQQLGIPAFGPQQLGIPAFEPQQFGVPAFGPQQLGIPAFEPQQFGVPELAPQQLGVPELAPQQTAVPAQQAEPAQQSSGSGVPSANDKRPAGDKRSAAQIVDDTPVLKNLGRQKDIKFEQLCKQTGIDPKLDLKDAKQNPDAVYRLAKVLEFIDSAKSAKGGERSSKVQNGQGDGNIEGITKDGDARHGTEAGMVKDFAEQGYSFLGEHQLPTTKDTHVKEDGSNKDNFQWFAGEAGKALWFIPGVSNVLTGVGNSEGGLKGVIEGAAGGVLQTWKGAAEGIIGAVTTGRVNPASMLLGAYTGALSQTEAAPQVVKDIAGMI